MVGYIGYGGLYHSRRNELVEAPACNPLPENAKTLESGNAGRDGYTVLSRADRETGRRNIARTTLEPAGPILEDY